MAETRKIEIRAGEDGHRKRMWTAVAAFTQTLIEYPGYREWKAAQLGRTLFFDDEYFSEKVSTRSDFIFSDELELQHAVIFQYVGLLTTVSALKDCEYYFRRYPFRGLPVSRNEHLTNICEMYFGRFYEFKERLKKYFKTLSAATPHVGLKIGEFIKLFEREFENELRERNLAHHHERFDDIALKRVSITGSLATGRKRELWKRQHLEAYRITSREWSKRVRVRAARMDIFLEVVAMTTLDACSFLKPDGPPSLRSSQRRTSRPRSTP